MKFFTFKTLDMSNIRINKIKLFQKDIKDYQKVSTVIEILRVFCVWVYLKLLLMFLIF